MISENRLIEDLESLQGDFKKSFNESRHFLLVAYTSQLVTSSIIREVYFDNNSQVRDYFFSKWPDLESNISSYLSEVEQIGGREAFAELLTEKAFLDTYRIFESFILDNFTILGLQFPELLAGEKESLKIDPNDLFENDSLAEIRRHVAEQEVQQIFIGKGVWLGILALFHRFQLAPVAQNEAHKCLNLASILRNAIMHHNSVLTAALARRAKRLSLDLSIRSDENVRKYLVDNYLKFWTEIGEFAIKVSDSIISQLKKKTAH